MTSMMVSVAAFLVFLSGLLLGLAAGFPLGWVLASVRKQIGRWLEDRRFRREVDSWIRELENERRAYQQGIVE